MITLGESGVGKTSIIRRYIHNIFDENNLSTIGLNFSFKKVTLKNGKNLNIKLIDTAGQEKYKALAKSYFKNSDAVLFVFALDDQESFDKITNWINLFNDNNHYGKEGIPQFLIGNKADKNRAVKKEVLDNFLSNNKYKYYETSAKDNTGIEELFQKLAEDFEKILEAGGNKPIQNSAKLGNFKNNNKTGCQCL